MISKHVSMRSVQKSSMAELVKYITSSQGKQERVGEVTITNCHALEPGDAIREMLAVQVANTRSHADKNYHLLVSFADGEKPAADVLKAIEARLCDALGYGEHQRVSAVHYDTDHVHIHIAINKVHPERNTIHTPLRDYKTLGETSSVLEREYGLVLVKHAGKQTVGQGRAADMEHHAGIESLMAWTKRECLSRLAEAASWAQVHQVMREHGLVMRPRGNGLIIESGEGLQIKASSVDRLLGKVQLEKKLGAFQPETGGGQASPRTRYQPRPIGYTQEGQKLFARYQAERLSYRKGSRSALQEARSKQTAALASLTRRTSLRRAAINLLPATERRLLFKLASQSTQRERAKIRQTFQRVRGNATARYPRLTWADWLRHQANRGDAQALQALRTRDMKGRRPMSVPPVRRPVSGVGEAAPPARRGLRPLLRLILGKPAVAAVGQKPPPMSRNRFRPLSAIKPLSQLGAIPVSAIPRSQQEAVVKREPLQATGAGQKPMGSLLKSIQKDSTTKHGTIIFRAGATAVRDDGKQIQVSRGATDDGLRAALALAAERFGSTLKINGSDTFKQHVIRLTAADKLPITFADPAMEQQRHQLTTGEHHAQRTERTERSGTDRGSAGGDGRAAGRRASAGDGLQRGATGTGSRSERGKPDVGAVGRQPPSQAQNRLRGLSELRLVLDAPGSEVLLPRDVPDHVEQQGADAVHGVRRSLHRGRVTTDPVTTYVTERESKRAKGLDIPAHKRYTGLDAGECRFAGIRQIEGQAMVLLERENTMLVLPITAEQLPRMKRRPIGETVTVSKDGAIKSKGRTKGRSA